MSEQARLSQKVAIITGATGGIGAATARKFLAEGANLLLVDLEAAKLKALATKLAQPERVKIFAGDVRSSEGTKAYIAAAKQHFGRIDVLFCNAGIAGTPAPTWEISEVDFDRMMDINVKGVWLGMKYAIPEMHKTGGGSIIATSSVAGIRAQARASSYVASKHAVVGLVRSVAIDAAKLNIRVNSINPGPIETDMVRSLEDAVSRSSREKAQSILQSNIPMKRYGKPEEVANLALFLASEESSFITGGIYTVDGGIAV